MLTFIAELKTKSAGLYLHQQPTSIQRPPAGKAMMCGVFAELKREINSRALQAGLARAKARGKIAGRPRNPKLLASIRKLLRVTARFYGRYGLMAPKRTEISRSGDSWFLVRDAAQRRFPGAVCLAVDYLVISSMGRPRAPRLNLTRIIG